MHCILVGIMSSGPSLNCLLCFPPSPTGGEGDEWVVLLASGIRGVGGAVLRFRSKHFTHGEFSWWGGGCCLLVSATSTVIWWLLLILL